MDEQSLLGKYVRCLKMYPIKHTIGVENTNAHHVSIYGQEILCMVFHYAFPIHWYDIYPTKQLENIMSKLETNQFPL